MNQPLYKKIIADLQRAIQNGELPPESQLPTEKELSERYQVSRITSKRALTELEQAGLIYRVQGRGSFVKKPTSPATLKKRILFMLPFVHDLSVGNFSEGITPLIEEYGFELMITTFDFLKNHSGASLMAEFDGLIYYADTVDGYLDVLFELASNHFPVIVLDKEIHELAFPTILSDNFEGGYLATQHLIELGHQKIAYICGSKQHPQSVRQRYLGYIQAINQGKLTFRSSLNDPISTESTVTDYLETEGITGIICENDLVAIEVMRQLKQQNYHVPKDFSIVGFDDIQAAALVDPPLTTIAQNFSQLGWLAGKLLLEQIQTGKIGSTEYVPIQLIPRNSSQQPRTIS